MNNRTYWFRRFAHYAAIAVVGFVIMQVVARLFWALIALTASLLTTLTTSIDIDIVWELLVSYPPDFVIFVTTQAAGMFTVVAIIVLYRDHRRKKLQ